MLLDVFALRESLIKYYHSCVGRFVRIKNPQIEERVTMRLGDGRLWPDPLIRLNPAFEVVETVDRGRGGR